MDNLVMRLFGDAIIDNSLMPTAIGIYVVVWTGNVSGSTKDKEK